MERFCLAHISDLHVLDLAGTSPLRFLNKRLSGLINLLGPRRAAHPAWLADALVERLQDRAIDHVAFTGDLTNLALPSEFSAGAALLARIGDGDRLSAVPGNHDVYTHGAAAASRAEAALLPWTEGAASRADWPFVKAPRPWLRIYGLHSAIPTAPLLAQGEVGAAQLVRLQRLVATEPAEVRVRVALLHHNLHRRGLPSRHTSQLRDAKAVLSALSELGFTAALHGHTHAPHRGTYQPTAVDGASTGAPPLLILGCGSSTWHQPQHGHFAHLSRLTLRPDGGVIGVATEVWDDDRRRFVMEHDDALPAALRAPVTP